MTVIAAPHDLELLFDQLATMDGKAEIIDGEIVPMAATGEVLGTLFGLLSFWPPAGRCR